jgi:hypothetical protein
MEAPELGEKIEAWRVVKRTFTDAAKAWRELAVAYSNLKRQA